MNQGGAIIDSLKLNALWQAPGNFGYPLLDVVDDIKRVRPETLQDDAARDFALAIEFGQATPFVRPVSV